MNFLFKLLTSCSRIPSFWQANGFRQGDSGIALLLEHFLVYFILAVLSFARKQI